MDWKDVALGLVGVVSPVIGWLMHIIWARLVAVDKRVEDHVEKHNELRVHIAETYAKKSEFDNLREWLQERFDDLRQELKSKADK